MNIRAGITAPISWPDSSSFSADSAGSPWRKLGRGGEPRCLLRSDIADCRDPAVQQATAKLLEKIPGTVMAVGDIAPDRESRCDTG